MCTYSESGHILILSQDNDDSHASPPETEHTTGVSHSFVHVIAKMILVSGYSRKKECTCFNLTQNKRNQRVVEFFCKPTCPSKLPESGLATKRYPRW